VILPPVYTVQYTDCRSYILAYCSIIGIDYKIRMNSRGADCSVHYVTRKVSRLSNLASTLDLLLYLDSVASPGIDASLSPMRCVMLNIKLHLLLLTVALLCQKSIRHVSP